MLSYLNQAQITVYNGSYFNANSTDQYRDQIINCNDDQNCSVICSGERSCYGTHIYCPTGPFACSVECPGDASCQYTNIEWIPGNINSFSCGSQKCHNVPYLPITDDTTPMEFQGEDGVIIQCPAHARCDVICTHCWESVIYCPLEHICDVTCSDCGYTSIRWPTDPKYGYLSKRSNLIDILKNQFDHILLFSVAGNFW